MSDSRLGSAVPPEDETSASEAEQLLRKAYYSPKELAELLDMPLTQIEQAAFAGRLRASIVEHDILSISRADVIDWLQDRP